MKLWSLVLEDSIPYERAERALVKVLRTAKFFPTAGEVREAAISLAAEDYTKRLEAEHRQHLLEATGRDGKRCSPEENLDEIAKMRIRVMGQK